MRFGEVHLMIKTMRVPLQWHLSVLEWVLSLRNSKLEVAYVFLLMPQRWNLNGILFVRNLLRLERLEEIPSALDIILRHRLILLLNENGICVLSPTTSTIEFSHLFRKVRDVHWLILWRNHLIKIWAMVLEWDLTLCFLERDWRL